MDITRENMSILSTNIKTEFNKGLGRAPDTYKAFSMEEVSKTSSDVYPISALQGSMRKWVGDRQFNNLKSLKMTLVNEPYENGMSISKFDVEDDQYGHYGRAAEDLGANAAKLWNDLAIGALLAPPVWADGAAFFGTTRKYGASTISNLSTAALTADEFEARRLAMQGYCGYDGKPLGIMPNLVIAGPKLEKTLFSILKDRYIVSGTTNKAAATDNPWLGACEYVIVPELTGTYANYWFLADTRGVFKPVLVQKRKEPTLVRKDAPTDDNMFYGAQIEYGIEARGAAMLTFPHIISAAQVTA